MNKLIKLTQANIEAMPTDSKLELAGAIWNSITASPKDVPLPQWHKDILDNRIADEHHGTDSWENVSEHLNQ